MLETSARQLRLLRILNPRSAGQVQTSTVEVAVRFAWSGAALQLEEAVVQDAVNEQPLQGVAGHQ